MDPSPFTLRSLLRMAESHQRLAWSHTSHVMWIIAETSRHRTDRKRPYDPREFNPMLRGAVQKGNPITKASLRSKAAAWRKSKGLEAGK